MRRTMFTLFVVTAVAEAISWLGLLTGMFFKYSAFDNELGVKIFGPIHGGLFIAYLAATVAVAVIGRWRWPVTTVALLCAVPPLATLAFERWARSRGRLAVPVADTA